MLKSQNKNNLCLYRASNNEYLFRVLIYQKGPLQLSLERQQKEIGILSYHNIIPPKPVTKHVISLKIYDIV